jgi:hypothetical protein
MHVTPVPDTYRIAMQEARNKTKRANEAVRAQVKFAEECRQDELDLERAIGIRLNLSAGHTFTDDDKYLVLTAGAENIALGRDNAHTAVELRRRNGTKQVCYHLGKSPRSI